MSAVQVCFDKDTACGDKPEGWCIACPKRDMTRAARCPDAAAPMVPWPRIELRYRFDGEPSTPRPFGWCAAQVAVKGGNWLRASRIVRTEADAQVIADEWAAHCSPGISRAEVVALYTLGVNHGLR